MPVIFVTSLYRVRLGRHEYEKAVYGVRHGVPVSSHCVSRHGQKSYLGRVQMRHWS